MRPSPLGIDPSIAGARNNILIRTVQGIKANPSLTGLARPEFVNRRGRGAAMIAVRHRQPAEDGGEFYGLQHPGSGGAALEAGGGIASAIRPL